MNIIPYRITICWSVKNDSYEATIPALRGCLAYGDTPEAAANGITLAAELWLAAATKHGKPIPAPEAPVFRQP